MVMYQIYVKWRLGWKPHSRIYYSKKDARERLKHARGGNPSKHFRIVKLSKKPTKMERTRRFAKSARKTAEQARRWARRHVRESGRDYDADLIPW